MTQENQVVDLFAPPVTYDKPVDTSDAGGFDKRLVTKLPEGGIICKLIADPRSPARPPYVPMNYYKFKVGNTNQDWRTRPSLLSLGLAEKDPENEKKWTLINKMSKMKKEGVSKDNPAYKVVFENKKKYEPEELGWLYFIEPNSNVIKCLQLKAAIINQLFGKPANGDKYPEIPSIVKALASKGMSPYDLSKEYGWIKIYKTGTEMATRYFVELCKETVTVKGEDGIPFETSKPAVFPIHSDFKTGKVTLDSFPDPVAYEKSRAFTIEETEEFIESDGAVFPSRYAGKKKRNNDDETPVDTETYAAAHDSVFSSLGSSSLDDIPF